QEVKDSVLLSEVILVCWGLPWLQVDCSEYRRLERPIYCERLYQPFCGSDGRTYNNKCSFCKAVL
uniref:Ovomucoid n=1 Tax=Cyanoderma ruficeps TaxID=181631 RepID=A0A8C3XH38_9PASS